MKSNEKRTKIDEGWEWNEKRGEERRGEKWKGEEREGGMERRKNERRREEAKGKALFWEKNNDLKLTFHCVGTALLSSALNACSSALVMTIRPLIAKQSESSDVWMTSNKRSNRCTSCSKITSKVDWLLSSFILVLSSFHFLSSCGWSESLKPFFAPVWNEKSFLTTVTRLGNRERMSLDKSRTMSSLVFLDLWIKRVMTSVTTLALIGQYECLCKDLVLQHDRKAVV